MAEWASLKAEKIIHRFAGRIGNYVLLTLLGCLIARANILGIYPFAIAYIAVLSMEKDKKVIPGLTGIIIGIASVHNYSLFLEILPCALLCIPIMPKIKNNIGKVFILPLVTALFSILPLLILSLTQGLTEDTIISLVVQGALAAGFTAIFFQAFTNKASLMSGNFSGEHGIVWILTISICLSGLQNLNIGPISLQIVALDFIILYIASKFGAGHGAGAGAILGFLLQWNFGMENLVDAGMYGLLGFVCGGFNRFGKIGMTISYSALILIFTFFVNEGFLYSHLYSSGLGLLLFILLPGKKKTKVSLKNRVMPEVETTVSKVKTLADIFDQLAFGFQAAGLEQKLKPEVPELMNILVERICRNCSTVNYCWEREFYRTYNFMFDLFAWQECKISSQNNEEKIPPEWEKYCGKLHEVMLAARFILEQQKDREVWQKRLALNRDAVAEQYRSVSKVIGHLARELNSRHNQEDGKPLVWSRRHRLNLDLGVGTFIKTGNGISGDNFSLVPLSETKTALIVCDGMGVGEDAARMSSAALTILEQLLSTGFEPAGAVTALNSILVLRSPEESFVTVDMAVIDTEAETAKLIKIGAAPTYLIGKDMVEVLETSSLPAGILNDIEIPVIDVAIKEKVLVIVTDGVIDVINKKQNWLKDFLEKIKSESAQDLADAIINEIMRKSGQYLEDDGVILVVRKKENDINI